MIGQQHGEAVDPDSKSGSGRHSILESAQIILIDLIDGLIVSLARQADLILEAFPTDRSGTRPA